MEWIESDNQLPKVCEMVLGYSPHWVDEDFNPQGIRETFLTDDGVFLSGFWHDSQDTWVTDDKIKPSHWMPRPAPPRKINSMNNECDYQKYLKSLNPQPEKDKSILIYGSQYVLYRDGVAIGIATWTKDENVGDSFQTRTFNEQRGIYINQVWIADSWDLVITKI